jgi:pyrophosphatase PpaX
MIEVLLFDFDGVIIDSRQANILQFQTTLKHFNLPPVEEELFQSLLELRTTDILKNLLPNLSDEELAPIYEYSRDMSFRNATSIELMPGVLRVLEELGRRHKLALVTNRGKRTVEILFNKHNLGRFFSTVIDREEVKRHKPHPEGILTAMKRLGVAAPEKALYIGDSRGDVEAAHNAGMRCVLISEAKESFGSDYQLQSIVDLPQLISQIEDP